MITERTLRQWRKEALELQEITDDEEKLILTLIDRNLRMTQELLDIQMLRNIKQKGRKSND